MSTATAHVAAQADSLGMAMIAASAVPLLLLDGSLRVIAFSRSFEAGFLHDAAHMIGRPLASLGSGEWGGDALQRRLEVAIAERTPMVGHEVDLRPNGRPALHLSLGAEIIEDGAADGPRLLLAITDLADIRARDKAEQDRLDDKDLILQELRHRIANSLQIISGLLMQTARRTASEETRGHLEAAHHRILSVAAVQEHLALARTGEVGLRRYLTTLCNNIAASMIADPAQLVLEVVVDDSVCDADDATSLGLMSTELVINALKYAFPDGRPGKITLSYASSASGWRLCVADDGVGMRGDRPLVSTGLGTVIVDAIARKLKATVLVEGGPPGVKVSIDG